MTSRIQADGKPLVHPQGLCESSSIGRDTRVWAFAHVFPDAQVGRDCNICDHVLVENDVIIGDRVTVKSGVQLWDGTRIADDVFVGPNATFTNDRFPRSKRYPDRFAHTVVEAGASIGANATLLSGVSIGRNAMVGAGAVVVGNVPAKAIVVGNPARIIGYVDTPKSAVKESVLTSSRDSSAGQNRMALSPRGCELWRVPSFGDLRGDLVALESAGDLPFVPARYFFVYGVASEKVRGEHAHRLCAQFLIPVNGALSVVVDDGERSQEVRLDTPSVGLYIPRRIWGIQYRFAPATVLAVFASHAYDPDDYIRDYREFLVAVGQVVD